MEKWNQRKLENEARSRRKAAAVELRAVPESVRGSSIENSHFALYANKLPLEDSVETVSFNRSVSELALKKVLNSELPIERFVALTAKILEQTYYEIFSRSGKLQPLQNLSIAKHYGVFFTPMPISNLMARQLSDETPRSVLLDPCLGSGTLLCSSLLEGSANKYRKLVGVELDPWLAQWSKNIIQKVAEHVGYHGCIEVHVGDGLDHVLSERYRTQENQLSIILNPPYGRLRLTRDRALNQETKLNMATGPDSNQFVTLQSYINRMAHKVRNSNEIFSNERGILEHSRLFYRACAYLVNRGSLVVIITPDSWMSGHDSRPLREYLFSNNLIQSVILIKETEGRFSTVNQSTSITLLKKNNRSQFAVSKLGGRAMSVRIGAIYNSRNRNLSIPRVSGVLLGLYEKLSNNRNFSEIPEITNARGEADQTQLKKLFTSDNSQLPLVRGEHIEPFIFNHPISSNKPSYIQKELFLDYIENKPKNSHFVKQRIVGKQCSYAQQSRRLQFALVPPRHVVGNSCNYLSLSGELTKGTKPYLVLGILNSAILDWYFRIQNNNNHVANYEIDSFPYPSNEDWFPLIEETAFFIANASNRNLPSLLIAKDVLEAAVALSYNINIGEEFEQLLHELEPIRYKDILNITRQLHRGIHMHIPSTSNVYFNHDFPRLSDLDKLVISYVSEGGNWQDIPSTVPSKRLEQIREMTKERGIVRTTYYGRLRRDQPAYTINTYFNRPGNGTHIHPILDRTLTAREAARLQSFPDKYVFLGGNTAIRNQIGNAVPPLLATAIGKKFVPYRKSGFVADVFCGAGGLSLGLEESGWHTIAAVDNDQSALDTYTFNRPSIVEPEYPVSGLTSIYKRDLHDRFAVESIVDKINFSLGNDNLDILAGGPPCQGFSHAGFRLDGDKRNDLAAVFINLAQQLMPRIFILENVEGLLTYRRGGVLREIIETLQEIGFRVCSPVWKLYSEQYGVPQMRRRIFIVATLDCEIDLSPPEPIYEICLGRREKNGTIDMFDSSLKPPFTVADALAGLSLPASETSLYTWLSSSCSSKVFQV